MDISEAFLGRKSREVLSEAIELALKYSGIPMNPSGGVFSFE